MSSLTADHYFWCSGGVPCCFEDVPGYYGMFQGCSGVVPGCSGVFQGCSGDVPGCSGGVPGCSGVFRGVPGFTDTRDYAPLRILSTYSINYPKVGTILYSRMNDI